MLAQVAWLPQFGVRGRYSNAVPQIGRVEKLPAHHPTCAPLPQLLRTLELLSLALSALPAAARDYCERLADVGGLQEALA